MTVSYTHLDVYKRQFVIDLFHFFSSLSNKFAPASSYSGRTQDSLLPIIQYL